MWGSQKNKQKRDQIEDGERGLLGSNAAQYPNLMFLVSVHAAILSR
jgi:hypothetical protein